MRALPCEPERDERRGQRAGAGAGLAALCAQSWCLAEGVRASPLPGAPCPALGLQPAAPFLNWGPAARLQQVQSAPPIAPILKRRPSCCRRCRRRSTELPPAAAADAHHPAPSPARPTPAELQPLASSSPPSWQLMDWSPAQRNPGQPAGR